MLCVLGGVLVCTPKRTYWLYVNGDDICCAYGFPLVCDCEVKMSGVAIQERMSGGWCPYEFQPVCDCKARMSSVAI